jgi:hypothetical protein
MAGRSTRSLGVMKVLVCDRCEKVLAVGSVLGLSFGNFLRPSSPPRCGTCGAAMDEREVTTEQARARHFKHERNIVLGTFLFVAVVLVLFWAGELLRG